MAQRVGIGDQHSQGVSVEVGEKEAAVDLTIVVEYGESIPKLSQQIRDNVTRRIEGITGLAVTEVNVTVNDLHFPGDDQPTTSPRAFSNRRSVVIEPQSDRAASARPWRVANRTASDSPRVALTAALAVPGVLAARRRSGGSTGDRRRRRRAAAKG